MDGFRFCNTLSIFCDVSVNCMEKKQGLSDNCSGEEFSSPEELFLGQGRSAGFPKGGKAPLSSALSSVSAPEAVGGRSAAFSAPEAGEERIAPLPAFETGEEKTAPLSAPVAGEGRSSMLSSSEEREEKPALSSDTKPGGADPIAVLRVIAMALVFLLHAKGFSEDRGFDQSACGRWAFLWQAPAWGGVWIFFLLSGYLIGKGFFSGRYQTSGNGVLRFYYKRWVKIGIPTYVAAALICIFFCPEFLKSQPLVLLRIVTFTYNGIPGTAGIGALWYISTLMWLYLLSPPVFLLGKAAAKKFSAKGKSIAAVLAIIALCVSGAGFRFGMLGKKSVWYECVYAPFWGNLDLYFCGFLLAFFAGGGNARLTRPRLATGKVLSCCLLAAVIVFASFAGYSDRFYDLYIALCPTLFLLAAGSYLLFFDTLSGGTRAEKFTFFGWIRHPSLIVNGIAGLGFEFYLLHSVVLMTAPRFAVRSNVGIHLSLCFYAAVITLLCSLFFRAGLTLFSLSKERFRLPKNTGFCHTSLKKWVATVAAIVVLAGGISLWCVKTPYSALAGSGTAADPYRISTAEEYLQFVNEVNAGKTFRKRFVEIAADLDFGGDKIDPCGSTKVGKKFSGTLDGKGHVLSGFRVEGNEVFGYDIGLFGWIEDGAVYNLGLENGSVTGACIGAFVSAGRGKIINCYSKIALSGARMGAVCDNFYGKIANCWSFSSFLNAAGAAGMVSYPATGIAVENCFLSKESFAGEKTADGAILLSAAEMNGDAFAALLNAYADPDLPLVQFTPGKTSLRFAV